MKSYINEKTYPYRTGNNSLIIHPLKDKETGLHSYRSYELDFKSIHILKSIYFLHGDFYYKNKKRYPNIDEWLEHYWSHILENIEKVQIYEIAHIKNKENFIEIIILLQKNLNALFEYGLSIFLDELHQRNLLYKRGSYKIIRECIDYIISIIYETDYLDRSIFERKIKHKMNVCLNDFLDIILDQYNFSEKFFLEKINNKNVSFKYLEELIFKYGICLTNNEMIKHAMNYENYALREHNWFYNRNPKNNKNLYFQEHKDYLNILSDSLTNREREILLLRYGLLDGRKNSYKNIKENLLYRSYYDLFIEIINLNWKLITYIPSNFMRNYIFGYFINTSEI